jgi:hypothetical protein
MISVSGRKRHPLIRVCRSLEEAEAVWAQMVADGYRNVRLIEDRDIKKLSETPGDLKARSAPPP